MGQPLILSYQFLSKDNKCPRWEIREEVWLTSSTKKGHEMETDDATVPWRLTVIPIIETMLQDARSRDA